MNFRSFAGAMVHDAPRFLRSLRPGRWIDMRNRGESVSRDGRGIRCEWEFTSELHLAKLFPSAGIRLLRSALREWPIVLREIPPLQVDVPDVAFVIGHRGVERLPHLLLTLRSIAGQTGAAIECVVVEQSLEPVIAGELPAWVRYVHTPIPHPDYEYNRSWTLNEGVRYARAPVVVLHDNDMLVPERYASECSARIAEGWDFLELKRFIFYLTQEATRAVFDGGDISSGPVETVLENSLGASIVARRDAYELVGGFDEGFVGWGGEDNEFWERCEVTGKTYRFGYLPFLHLFHSPQKGKFEKDGSAAVQRYRSLRSVPPAERIARLREKVRPRSL
jgi:hypothetical protein